MFLQTAQDNIDLQTTILSRFDLIFIVKDVRMYSQDKVSDCCVLFAICITLQQLYSMFSEVMPCQISRVVTRLKQIFYHGFFS